MAKKAQVEKHQKKEKVTKQKKEKKTKAKKDKNAPKRAISAFFFYQKERREPLKKEQPALDNKQLISKMSEEWNNMNDTARVPFNKMAEGDKVRYEKAKKEYEKTKGTTSGKATPVPAKGSEKKSAKKSTAKKVESASEAEDEE
jgi:structure-specific recognition protein 1